MSKLVMLGTASNRGDAPFDSDVEIWGCGGVITREDVKRCDAVFELHPRRYWGRPEVLKAINAFPGEVYMQDVYPEIPNSVRYPIEKIKETFYMPTMGESLYMTNTVSYMLALAAVRGYTEIETYGIWMEAEGEYAYQRPNCEFYVGYLHAKGVKVTIYGGEVLTGTFLYGYEEPGILPQLIEDSKTLEAGRKELEADLEAKRKSLYMQEGGIRYNKNLRRSLGGY